jgi:hypothetical protein
MRIREALGIGQSEGTTAIPVSVWLPVLVVFSAAAVWISAALGRESGLIRFAVVGVAMGLVIPVAAGITLWRNRHRG